MGNLCQGEEIAEFGAVEGDGCGDPIIGKGHGGDAIAPPFHARRFLTANPMQMRQRRHPIGKNRRPDLRFIAKQAHPTVIEAAGLAIAQRRQIRPPQPRLPGRQLATVGNRNPRRR